MRSTRLATRWFSRRFAAKRQSSNGSRIVSRSINDDFTHLSDDEAALIKSVSWYHGFKLALAWLLLARSRFALAKPAMHWAYLLDLTNQHRTLDVGSWDGPLAFEIEAPGADHRA